MFISAVALYRTRQKAMSFTPGLAIEQAVMRVVAPAGLTAKKCLNLCFWYEE